MDTVQLSICIPTYNRADYLKNLLDSILIQKTTLKFEVRIQDNDSSDHTKDIVSDFCRNFPYCVYEKNDHNLGGKVNIRKCTESAIGKYLLIIGDDDILISDAIEQIRLTLNSLEKKKFKAIFFNSKLQNYFETAVLFKHNFEWLQKVAVNEPAFISSVLWDTDFWKKFSYYENIKTFNLPQLHCFIDACHQGYGSGRKLDLVEKGNDNPTNVTSYWFYKFHAIVDCFEYPYLYKQILTSKTIDFNTRIMILVRKSLLLKEIVKKIAFMKNNEDEYENYVKKMKQDYIYFPPYTWVLKIFIAIIMNSRFGERAAKRICPAL